MTEPERPADAPAPVKGPTPEEISARLEALLKRTHAMRQAAGANPAGPMTWPPSTRELDHFDVVDVPDDQRLQPTGTPPGTDRPPVAGGAPSAAFERPDWGELRLRGAVEESSGVSRWWQMLTVVLAAIAIAQGAYLWSLPSSTASGAGEARLRIDGPVGAEVRVDGRHIGPVPIEHTLPPGAYDVEIVQDGTAQRARRVAIEAGRTTVVWTAAAAAAPSAATPAEAASASASSSSGGPALPAPSAASRPATAPDGAISATLGAVLIESTPAGLPVTMEGRPRGVTPLTVGRLKPGRHDVLVGGLARQVDVTANAVATLRVTRQ